MSKWELQQKIQRYEKQIEENKNKILDYEQKIELLSGEKAKIYDIQTQIDEYYSLKRIKCETLCSGVRGRSSYNIIKKCIDSYSVTNCNEHIEKLDNINTYINININNIKELIAELNFEIKYMHSTILGCRDEIKSIEKREEEEIDARFNHM